LFKKLKKLLLINLCHGFTFPKLSDIYLSSINWRT